MAATATLVAREAQRYRDHLLLKHDGLWVQDWLLVSFAVTHRLRTNAHTTLALLAQHGLRVTRWSVLSHDADDVNNFGIRFF